METKLKTQRGIKFLKILLSELRDPQVFDRKDHPALKHMYEHMQDKRFDVNTEPFKYRKLHFPRFLKSLYKQHQDIPKEFREYIDSDMLLGLIADFIKQGVLAGKLEDMIENPESHEREYMFFCFRFFAAMEDRQVDEIAKREGGGVDGTAVLEIKANGGLAVVTGRQLEERKKNQKTEIESWNPFGGNSVDDMHEVCRRKGEMAVMRHIQGSGFEIQDLAEVAGGDFSKVVAENRETGQKVEIYVDKHGAPKHFVDLNNPQKRQIFESKNGQNKDWRDQMVVLTEQASKRPDTIAAKADEAKARGPLKSDPGHSSINVGNVKIGAGAFKGLTEPDGKERSTEDMSGSESSHKPGYIGGNAPFSVGVSRVGSMTNMPVQRRPRISLAQSGTSEDGQVVEGSESNDQRRPRVDAHGQTLGEIEIGRRQKQKGNKKPKFQKKKTGATLADSALKWTGGFAALGSVGTIFTSFLV